MNTTHETLVNALAHHMAFFTIMAIGTCSKTDVDQYTDTALELWLDQHGYSDQVDRSNLAIEALEASVPLMQDAIRSGKGAFATAGKLVLQWAEAAGLSRLQFIQRPMH